MDLAHHLTNLVHLDAAQDILRPCYPPKVWRVSAVAQVNPSSSPSTACTALCARAASPRATSTSPSALLPGRASPLSLLLLLWEEGASRAQVEASCTGKSTSLVDHVLILVAIFSDHVVEDLDKGRVLLERLWTRRDLGSRSNGKSLRRWVVLEVGEYM